MSRLSVLGDAFSRGVADWKLWLVHSVANPLLFVLFVFWLLIPESSGWALGLSLAGVVALVAAVLVLHSATLSYLSRREPSAPRPLVAAFVRALRNLVAFAVCAGAAYLLWNSANLLDVYRVTFPAYLRAAMPAFLRRNITEMAVASVYSAASFFVRWIVWPGLLLPFIAAVASFGFTGFVRGGPVLWRCIRSGFYWLVIAAAALVLVILAPAVMAWHPVTNDDSFAGESISMAVRFFAALVMSVASWLAACSMASAELRGGHGTFRQALR